MQRKRRRRLLNEDVDNVDDVDNDNEFGRRLQPDSDAARLTALRKRSDATDDAESSDGVAVGVCSAVVTLALRLFAFRLVPAFFASVRIVL